MTPGFQPVTAELARGKPLFNHTDIELPYRSARPIPDPEVIAFLDEFERTPLRASLEDQHIRLRFLEAFPEWLLASQLNSLNNLNSLPIVAYTNGTIQAFDAFYLQHARRRFRCFQSEFMYHRATWRDRLDFLSIDAAPLAVGDAVVISLPFSDLGGKHPQTDEVIDRCNYLNIPVLIDCAYMNIAAGMSLDFSQPSIQVATFSLSKTFHGLDKLRIGVRFSRQFNDDLVDIFNTVEMSNQFSCAVGLAAINRFPADFNCTKYREKQVGLCRELGITPTDCVIFGLGDDRWNMYSRGGGANRLCLSAALAAS